MLKLDYDKLVKMWSQKRGLAFVLMVVIVITWGLIETQTHSDEYLIVVYPIECVIVYAIWAYTTCRIPSLLKGGWHKIHVVFICDHEHESEIDLFTKTIVRSIQRKLNRFSVDISLQPVNRFETDEAIDKWKAKYFDQVDGLVVVDISSGGVGGTTKYKLKAKFYFAEKHIGSRNRSANLVGEVTSMNLSQDWEYLLNNSFIDKDKIKNNLLKLFLLVSGIISSNEEKYARALKILEVLFSGDKTVLFTGVENVNRGERVQIWILLLVAYINSSIDSIKGNNTEIGINNLTKAELLIGGNKIAARRVYMNLAFLYYKSGNLAQAKSYTQKLGNLDPNSFGYLVNCAFLAILEGDIATMKRSYQSIRSTTVLDANPLEVIDFLEQQKAVHPNKVVELTFGQAIIALHYLDSKISTNYYADFLKSGGVQPQHSHLNMILSVKVAKKRFRK